MSAPPAAASGAAALPPLKLKIRTPTGDKVLQEAGVTKQSTLLELQQRLEALSGIPLAEQQLSATYPPPGHVFEGPEWATLGELKIMSNDVLVLKRIAPVPAPAPAAAPAPVPAPAAAAPSSSPQPPSLEALSHLRPLSVQPIANDNSCLFNATGGLLEGFDQCGSALVTELRQTVASVVQAASPDDERFSEAALNGLSRDKYAAHILQAHSWGGGIELAVLAEAFDVEIAAVDVETCHQYLFGASDDPTQQKKRRIYLVYYGVHYDALEDRDVAGAPRRIFDPLDHVAEQRALLAARQLQAAGSFTNVSRFTLRCAQCQQGLVGAHEAQEHAKATGHANFEEYRN